MKRVIKGFFGDKRDARKYIDFSHNRVGQDVRYALDDSKLRELGWSAQKRFNDEIDSIVEYYKKDFTW